MKYANITPVYKAGDRSLASNYRPISILNLFSKLFESLVQNSLLNHTKHVIYDCQHGFQAGRSTATNLICYVDHLSKEINAGNQVDSIYLDFSKAFDSVSHHLLLHKLTYYGIAGTMHNWFESYLSGRCQRVVINGHSSPWGHVRSGVPQGSILGPSLFVMYINDLVKQIRHSRMSLYADDSKLFHTIKSKGSCRQLQCDLNNVVKWCNVWKLKLNLDKCLVISFTNKRSLTLHEYRIDNVGIKRVHCVKDLGVLLTSNLNFNLHVNNVVCKSYKMLGFLKRTCKSFSNVIALKLLYFSLVRSQLDYCSQVWAPHQSYLARKLERVQVKFIKFLCFKCNTPYNSSQYESLCKHFSMPTLAARRQISDLCFLHKCLNNTYNCSYVISESPFHCPSRNLRHHELFRFSNLRLNIRKFSYLPRTCTLFNKLSLKFTSLDLFSNFKFFKCVLRSHWDSFPSGL